MICPHGKGVQDCDTCWNWRDRREPPNPYRSAARSPYCNEDVAREIVNWLRAEGNGGNDALAGIAALIAERIEQRWSTGRAT
jgi:hypothetical protein